MPHRVKKLIEVLLENSADMIFILRGSVYTEVNLTAARCLGYDDPRELIGMSPQDISPELQPDGTPSCRKIEELTLLAVQEGTQTFEWRHIKKDGATLDCRINLSASTVEGDKLLLMIGRDITEKKRSEELLRLSEEKFRNIFENAPIGIYQSTVAGRLIKVNQAMVHMFGYDSPEDMVNSITDIEKDIFVHPELRHEMLRQVLASDQYLRFENEYRRRDGATFITNLYMKAVRRDGKIAFIEGFVEDITDRKNAEEALKRSEEKYRELVQNANSIILRWDHEGNVHFLNEFGQRFFGFSEEEIVGKNVVGTIVPETETSGRDLVALMEDICQNPMRYRSNINENMRKNGERVWVAWTNKPIFNEQQRMVEILSVGVDVTERRQDQEALQVYADIVHHMQVGLYVYHLEDPSDDRTLRLLAANPASTADLGLHEEEIIGCYIDDIFPGLRGLGVPHLFAEVARSGGSCNVDELVYSDRRIAPTVFSFRVFAVPGNRVGVLFEDITEIKRIEDEKKQFYKETISSVTDGKLQIVTENETRDYERLADVRETISTYADTSAVRADLEEYCRQTGLSSDSLFLFLTGLGEAMTNAIKHAGAGKVFAGRGDGSLWAGVSDSGPGISALTLPKATLRRGYSTKVSLGMGYSIMLDVADRIMLSTGPEGTTVVLQKSLVPLEPVLSLEDIRDTWESIAV